jgi:hypothetical protein
MKKSLKKKKKLFLENTEKINELLTLDLVKKVKQLHKKVDKLLKKSQQKKYVILRQKKSKYEDDDDYDEDEYNYKDDINKSKYSDEHYANQEYDYKESQSFSPYINGSSNKYNVSPSISSRRTSNTVSSIRPTPKRLSFSPNNIKSTVKKLSSPIAPSPRTKFLQQHGTLSSRFTKATTMTPQIARPTPNKFSAANALLMLGRQNIPSHRYNLRPRTTNYTQSPTKSPRK